MHFAVLCALVALTTCQHVAAGALKIKSCLDQAATLSAAQSLRAQTPGLNEDLRYSMRLEVGAQAWADYLLTASPECSSTPSGMKGEIIYTAKEQQTCQDGLSALLKGDAAAKALSKNVLTEFGCGAATSATCTVVVCRHYNPAPGLMSMSALRRATRTLLTSQPQYEESSPEESSAEISSEASAELSSEYSNEGSSNQAETTEMAVTQPLPATENPDTYDNPAYQKLVRKLMALTA